MTPPYTPIEMLRAMQRDWYEKHWEPFTLDNREQVPTPCRERPPDPIGLAIMRLRPIERITSGAVRIVRFGRAGTRRVA